ncbi:hypothetical protein LOC71_04595 [Rhodopirellula sp. JC740]|uniref:Uncharacterized protein n=1 Tax=Rhodopirellula halodulae TaxID=2894198 RepID=A0ABS8NDB1_9BACT|nr:hypothetical protein [Rhodopirellula sp. JC740]MCC9641541.1 hypothetical protein [Rhodopirellula sp. JC740]
MTTLASEPFPLESSASAGFDDAGGLDGWVSAIPAAGVSVDCEELSFRHPMVVQIASVPIPSMPSNTARATNIEPRVVLSGRPFFIEWMRLME